MKQNLSILALCLLLAASCRKETNPEPEPRPGCNVADPLTNLSWLKTQMDDFRQKKQEDITYVTLTEYKGQQYIQVYQSFMSCSFCVLYQCDGTRVDVSAMPAAEQQPFLQYVSDSRNKVQLWPRR